MFKRTLSRHDWTDAAFEMVGTTSTRSALRKNTFMVNMDLCKTLKVQERQRLDRTAVY